ncbi:MAG: 2-phospho-L-lactate transferase [Candidatus Hodarchaeales archaeon]|jgi:LPPG:FO 2-phospho-L-lactate transferase
MVSKHEITVLSGGTGTPKLIEGFNALENPHLTVIANTGDDWIFYGIHVSPDVDTVLLVLSDHLNKEKYWGLVDDTFNMVSFLKQLKEDVWFNLGDKDAGLCLLRTNMLQKGLDLTTATTNLAHRLGIRHEILPMCNERVECRLKTSKGDLHLEEYWIKEKGQPEVHEQYLKGIRKAKITPQVETALIQADLIIIGPSNPVSSVDPILSVPGFKKLLEKSLAKKSCVSPVIGDKPFSGPAAQFLRASGFEVSPLGIAKFYQGLIDSIFIHETDTRYMKKIEKLGIEAIPTNISLRSMDDKIRLAKFIMKKMS